MASGSLADALGQLISGAGAGVAATFITNPLDTMKVEAQNGGMSAAEMITRCRSTAISATLTTHHVTGIVTSIPRQGCKTDSVGTSIT